MCSICGGLGGGRGWGRGERRIDPTACGKTSNRSSSTGSGSTSSIGSGSRRSTTTSASMATAAPPPQAASASRAALDRGRLERAPPRGLGPPCRRWRPGGEAPQLLQRGLAHRQVL
ncbi:unnamed protein product [Prorocentrum cordatum]|uniref:Uncharacterized protein n=1 Tax=Prorocentrum cordatum TaxID=2364126 RepID=A0ABN9PCZ6_9DINO|nr:unnamed protein product [Polarella glacialis]